MVSCTDEVPWRGYRSIHLRNLLRLLTAMCLFVLELETKVTLEVSTFNLLTCVPTWGDTQRVFPTLVGMGRLCMSGRIPRLALPLRQDLFAILKRMFVGPLLWGGVEGVVRGMDLGSVGRDGRAELLVGAVLECLTLLLAVLTTVT